MKRIWHRIHDRWMVKQLARLKPGGLLLDVGAGDGRFIRAARALGDWTIVCTEYSPAKISSLADQGFDARQGEIDEVGLAPGSADVIWASHVIEHMPDVEGFLAKARRLLKPDGVLIILIPSSESLRARLHLTTWHLVNPPGHLWGFRPSTLRNVLSNNGFVVRRIQEVHLICEMFCVAQRG
jgi:2-polyprenyl-3-methyl-5-hydroxy-6-metoxy-1,4-benzoquinol methylase